MAQVTIGNSEEPILAVCLGCDGASTRPPTVPTTTGPTLPPLEGVRRTVVFIKKQTSVGQDMFVRGGIDAGQRPPCLTIADDCNLPFKVFYVQSSRSRFNFYFCFLLIFFRPIPWERRHITTSTTLGELAIRNSTGSVWKAAREPTPTGQLQAELRWPGLPAPSAAPDIKVSTRRVISN